MSSSAALRDIGPVPHPFGLPELLARAEAATGLAGKEQDGTPLPPFSRCPHVATLNEGSTVPLSRPRTRLRALAAACLSPSSSTSQRTGLQVERPHSHPQVLKAVVPLGQAQCSCRPGGLCCVCMSGRRYRENLGESLMGGRGLRRQEVPGWLCRAMSISQLPSIAWPLPPSPPHPAHPASLPLEPSPILLHSSLLPLQAPSLAFPTAASVLPPRLVRARTGLFYHLLCHQQPWGGAMPNPFYRWRNRGTTGS